jgi:hypothetical protein
MKMIKVFYSSMLRGLMQRIIAWIRTFFPFLALLRLYLNLSRLSECASVVALQVRLVQTAWSVMRLKRGAE